MLTHLRPDHFTVLTDDLDATTAFYRELLGLLPGPRPEMSRDGVWLYAGERAVLHVIHADPLPAQRRGVLDHMAFRADSVDALVAELQRRGMDYHVMRTAAPWQQWQLFFTGPSGERVEVDCGVEGYSGAAGARQKAGFKP